MNKVIIIPVYNQLDFVQKCIESVIKYTDDLKLIVVDDASTDFETTKWLKENANSLKYDFIYHDKSQGFSKTANDGIDYAVDHYRFNCLCVLNSDTEIITEGWFEKVEQDMVAENNVGIAGVLSNNAESQSVEEQHYLCNMEKRPTVECPLIHGFCLFLSTNLLKKVKHYNHETFPNYASDYDFCLNSIKAGFKNILVGRVFVRHFGKKSGITDDMKLVKDTLAKKWPNLNKCLFLSVKSTHQYKCLIRTDQNGINSVDRFKKRKMFTRLGTGGIVP